MFVMRETFTARPGMASKLGSLFKDVLSTHPVAGARARVLHDAVGTFNTVVIETEVDDFSTFDAIRREYETRPELRERMKGYTDLYLTGTREIFRVA